MRLSKRYGLNPSMGLCFYCQKAKEVVLFGANGGKEAPRDGVYKMEPCEECKGWMKQGVILISCRDGEDRPDNRNPYRTGGWCVLKDDALRRMMQAGKALDHILRVRFAFVPDEAWDALGLPREDLPNGN